MVALNVAGSEVTRQSDNGTNENAFISPNATRRNVTADVANANITKSNLRNKNVTIITATIPGFTKTTLALQHVLTKLVTASQVHNTKIIPAPLQCSAPRAADNDECLIATLNELRTGNITIAILPVSSLNAQPTRMLHYADIIEQDDLTDRSRRACLATGFGPTPPSLLDLADSSIAAKYYVPDNVIDSELRRLTGHNVDKYVNLIKNARNSTCDLHIPLVSPSLSSYLSAFCLCLL